MMASQKDFGVKVNINLFCMHTKATTHVVQSSAFFVRKISFVLEEGGF